MRQRYKVLIAVASIILILVVSVLPTFAIPLGASALNFCGLGTEFGTNETEYLLSIEIWDQWETSSTYPDAEIYWDASIGGFEYNDFPETYIQPGDTICVTLWWLGTTGGMALLPYSNTGAKYYIFNELVLVDSWQGTYETINLNFVQAYNSRGMAHTDEPNWSGESGIDGGIQDDTVPMVYVEFWYEYEGSETITADNIGMRWTTITQDLRIYNGGAYGTYTEYQPFNKEWFIQNGQDSGDVQNAFTAGYNTGFIDGKREGYDIGFNDGYTAGYNEGTVANEQQPVQSWSNFIFTGVTGFLSFEIYPGFPLWGLLGAIIAIPLLIAFLKLFAGG